MPRRNNTPKHLPFSRPKPAHTKRRFANEQDALKAAELGMLQDIHLTLSVYLCDECGGWHLTSTKR